MTTIGTAYVQVLPSVEGIQNNLKSALSGPAASAGDSAGAESGQSFIGSMAGKIALGAAAVVGAATAVVAGAVKAASQIADLGDEIDKNSQKLGISAQAYQEWDAVLQHSGTSMSAQTATFRTLTKATQNSSADQVAAFQKLGLSMEQVASMNTEDLFGNVISALQGMEEGSERTAIATALLGRGATELGPLLNTSAEDTQAMIDRVNELGGVMSDSAVKSGAAYKDSLQDLQTAMEGLKNNLLIGLLPAITFVMDKLTGWVTQIRESTAFQNIKEKIDGLKDNLSGMGDKFDAVWGFVKTTVEGAGGVIVAAVNLIIDAVKWLVEQINTDGTFLNQAWNAITSIFETASGVIQGLLGTLTAILKGDWEGALENLKQVAEAIWNGIKDLFGQAWEAIKGIFAPIGEWFSDRWNDITNAFSSVREWFDEKFTAAKEAVHTAWSAIGGWFSDRWSDITGVFAAAEGWFSTKFTAASDAVHSAWSGIGTWFSGKWTEIQNVFNDAKQIFSEIGGNIVQGIKDGILAAWERFTGWVTEKFNNLVGGVKSLLGISSPSKVFASIGDYMVQGLGQGWDKAFGQVKSGIEDDLNFSGSVTMGPDFRSYDFAPKAVDFAPQAGTVTNNFTVNVYSEPGMDEEKLVDFMMIRLQEETDKEEAALA